MSKKQIFSIFSVAFFVIAVFQLIAHGITALAGISLILGSVMTGLLKKEKDKENDEEAGDQSHQDNEGGPL